MAWLESHQALDRHPKIVMLKARMRWSQNETIGFVHRLWWLVLEYAPTSGDLRALPPMVVGELLGMKESDVAKAIEHMVDVGLIDKGDEGSLFIHDWHEFGGKYQAKKDLARQRVRKHRDSCNANVRVTDALPARNVRECNATEESREDKNKEMTKEKIAQLQQRLIDCGAGDFGIQISNAMLTHHPGQVENGIANFCETGNKQRATWNYIQKFIDSAPQAVQEKKDPYDDGTPDF